MTQIFNVKKCRILLYKVIKLLKNPKLRVTMYNLLRAQTKRGLG